MKPATITLPSDLAELVDLEAKRRQISAAEVVRQLIVLGLSGASNQPREIPWAGLFHDPTMITGERIDEALAPWADDLDRDRR